MARDDTDALRDSSMFGKSLVQKVEELFFAENASAQARARNEVKRERMTPGNAARLVWHHLW
jgi:hypothetical protein